jgi:molybdenum cofactor cytidylyltransferase
MPRPELEACPGHAQEGQVPFPQFSNSPVSDDDGIVSAVALVLAAGLGTRFSQSGANKLLTAIDGEPMVGRTIRSALDGGCARAVVVVAPGRPMGVEILDDPRVITVENPDPSRGMFSSIQAGIAVAPGDPCLVIPGDMPFIASDTIERVRAEAERTGRIVSPRWNGKRGHPVALPARLYTTVLAADAAATLSAVLAAFEADRTVLDVDDSGILRDVDAPSDLARDDRP